MARKIIVRNKSWLKSKIQVNSNGCWIWQMRCNNTGYGQFTFSKNKVRKAVRVHRFAYELYKGPIPEGLLVCHVCDVPPCCNPEHLWVGTYSDNQQDSIKKGRNFQLNLKYCPRGHMLVKKLDTNQRYCTKCFKKYQIEWRLKNIERIKKREQKYVARNKKKISTNRRARYLRQRP